MELKTTRLHFKRNGFSATVKDVTAYVCPQCGATLIPGPVAEQVSDTVERLFQTAQEASQVTPEHALPFSRLSFQWATA